MNGGFIAASPTVIEAVRQKADTYIYTNPLSAADCAAAAAAVDICDGPEGRSRLAQPAGDDGAVPPRDRPARVAVHPRAAPDRAAARARHRRAPTALVGRLFDSGILAVGLTFPVVPRGDETIRFQINAAHTAADIDLVLEALARFR